MAKHENSDPIENSNDAPRRSGRKSKASVAAHLPVRRGLSEVEAAVYLSLSPSFFRRLVDQAIMPASRLCLLPCSRIRAHG